MSRMDGEIWMTSEKEGIQDVGPVLPGKIRLDSSETKLILTSKIHFFKERRRRRVRNEDDSGSGYLKTVAK